MLLCMFMTVPVCIPECSSRLLSWLGQRLKDCGSGGLRLKHYKWVSAGVGEGGPVSEPLSIFF